MAFIKKMLFNFVANGLFRPSSGSMIMENFICPHTLPLVPVFSILRSY